MKQVFERFIGCMSNRRRTLRDRRIPPRLSVPLCLVFNAAEGRARLSLATGALVVGTCGSAGVGDLEQCLSWGPGARPKRLRSGFSNEPKGARVAILRVAALFVRLSVA